MKGGLLLPNKNEKETFLAYLDNSDIDFLSKGSYGLTLKTSIIYKIPVKPKPLPKEEPEHSLYTVPLGDMSEDETAFHTVPSEKADEEFHSVAEDEKDVINTWEVRLSKTNNTHYFANLLNGFSSFDVPDEIKDNQKYLPKINFYKKITPDKSYGKPVTNLVLKLVLISETNNRFQISKKEGLYTVQEEDFKNEINIQTDIFFKTITYLQPLCPGIVYSDIIKDKSEILNFLTIIYKRCDSELQPVINEINKICATNSNVSFGVIGMECADKFSTIGQVLNNFKSNPQNIMTFRGMAQYALLKLATDTGYSHNDFHNNNILLGESFNYFYEGQIMPLLIDFGRTVKIPLDILEKIKENIANKNYIDALSLLCDKSYANEFLTALEHANSHYGWVCGDYNLSRDEYLQIANRELVKINADIVVLNKTQPPGRKYALKTLADYEKNYPQPKKLNPSVNLIIDKLYSRREKAIDNNIQIMRELHDNNSEIPLLPIADSIKGQLYKGLIGGKNKKNKKRKTYKLNKKQKKFTRKF